MRVGVHAQRVHAVGGLFAEHDAARAFDLDVAMHVEDVKAQGLAFAAVLHLPDHLAQVVGLACPGHADHEAVTVHRNLAVPRHRSVLAALSGSGVDAVVDVHIKSSCLSRASFRGGLTLRVSAGLFVIMEQSP
ncbi:hypothetical protein SDC9_210353 [bioreactor metagenome]|uniref:Uncharacterized protein n=1 Tax=bioreactor metagenome TaxID=1076179 RepID=A0A645JG65_9ZZZZ